MSSKKINKKKELIQQKKIIASKLLKISLKLDDYIYKNSPISIQEAKTYAQEIAQLKLKCTDVRSLQVTEKLTSIVKSIIAEQSSNDVTSTEDTNTPLLLHKDSESINETHQSNYVRDHTINIENVPQSDKGHEINETSSNLNISKDVDNTAVALNDVKAENVIVETNTENLSDNHHVSTPINNESKDMQSEQMVIEKNNNKINLNEMDVNPCIPIEDETINNNIKESDKININSTIKNINDKINKPICNIKSKPSEKKHQEMINQNLKPKKNTVRKNNNKMATNIKCSNKALNGKINKNITKANTNFKAPTTKAKKKKEIVDLSWIENIKYVREINADEHIVTNLQESFWSNLTMPADPNFDFDAEFIY
ncbi:unnamed protein product, partial [Brenthis ino]